MDFVLGAGLGAKIGRGGVGGGKMAVQIGCWDMR